MNHKLEIKTAQGKINSLRYADDITLMAEREEELKSLLMQVNKESQKACLKLNIQKTQIMASSPISSWQNGNSGRFLFLVSKINVDGDYSHDIKRHLSPWKKSYNKPRHCIKKQRRHFPNKSLYSQSYSFASSHVQM